MLFDWKLIAVMIFLVPLATLGTCLGWLTADGRNYGDLKWLSIPLNIDFFSIAIGVVMILTNLVMLAIKRQK